MYKWNGFHLSALCSYINLQENVILANRLNFFFRSESKGSYLHMQYAHTYTKTHTFFVCLELDRCRVIQKYGRKTKHVLNSSVGWEWALSV